MPVAQEENDLAGRSGIIFPKLLFNLAFAHVAVVEFKMIMQDGGVRVFLEGNIQQAFVVQKLPDHIPQTDIMVEKEGWQGFRRKGVGILAVLVPDAFQSECPVFDPELISDSSDE